MHEAIPLYVFIMAAAAIAASMVMRRIQPRVLRWFAPFLIVSLLVDIVGRYMSWHQIVNHWLFNLFTAGEFLFYSYIFLRLIESPKWKKVIVYSILIYPLLFVANLLWVEGFIHFHTITYRIGSVMVVLWCYLYFRQLMRSPGYTTVTRNPVFWISTGLMFFYTGFFFYMSAGYILLYTGLKVGTLVWNIISGTLNALLYGCFLIAFLWGIRKRK
jgi:hypothetical protein